MRASKSALAVLLMLVGTECFYLRPGILLGRNSLAGSDYDQLHVHHLRFAREALFGSGHTLPAWNPHELLGSPFAANVQSFPWIPTRLLLLALDPSVAYAAGVALAAALAALFTWLYCRRVGLSATAAAAAGATFACAGYFSSRVMAGHLPLLEGYPALPLLLWLVDRALREERERRHRVNLAILAFCTACVAAAGHPQLPAYAVAAAILYAFWRGRGKQRARVLGAITLGTGLAAVVLWPMLLLIGRSTRVLHLAAPDNDIAMTFRRVMALVVPGIDGYPIPIKLAEQQPFTGYPTTAYFWDTASYMGILPLVAIAALVAVNILKKQIPGQPWKYLALLGGGAFFLSLTLAQPLHHLLPGTMLRSPARLLYVSTFCAAVALGSAVDALLATAWPTALRRGLVMAFLSLHLADLWGFSSLFIQQVPLRENVSLFFSILDSEVGDGRIAGPDNLVIPYGDHYDDAGGFDSIFLAKFYRGVLALAGKPPDLNEQKIDASDFPVRALEATGVRFVITAKVRGDLQLVTSTSGVNLYRVANPAPRAHFFTAAETEFVAEEFIPELFAERSRTRLLLPPAGAQYAVSGEADSAIVAPSVRYVRPSSDEILLYSAGPHPGFVEVLDAFDTGWTARVDGADAPLLPANGFAIAVPVGAGNHVVRLRYATPGRATGVGLSLLSMVLLIALITSSPRGQTGGNG